MDQTLTLGWTQAQSAARRAGYRRAMRLALLVEAAVALAALAAPLWLAGLVTPGDSVPPEPAADWIRAFGVALLMFVAVQLTAARNPLRKRWLNSVAILSRGLLALALAILGVLWLAIAEALLFLLLAILFYRFAISELMTRP